MTVTPSKLTRAAGLAAVAAGVLFIVIQPVHPVEDVSTVTSNAWAVVGYMTLGFSVLGLVGATGIYLRQVRAAGVLGLVGYLLFAAFLLLTTAFTFAETLILPPLAAHAPRFVDSVLGIFDGSPGEVELGALGGISAVAFALYLLGGSLFGIAILRARVLSRWAALMLVVGAVSTLLVPLLPHALGRYVAVPMGIALVGLGSSLWARQGHATAAAVSDSGTTPSDLVAAE